MVLQIKLPSGMGLTLCARKKKGFFLHFTKDRRLKEHDCRPWMCMFPETLLGLIFILFLRKNSSLFIFCVTNFDRLKFMLK